jgi:hypothetical protein
LVVGGWKQLFGYKPFQFFFLNLHRRRMELNTFFTEDDCGSDSHSTGRRRGRGRVAAQVEVGAVPVGVGVVKVVCLLQQRDLQGSQKGSMDQFQELVNLDQLPLGRQRNGLGKLP